LNTYTCTYENFKGGRFSLKHPLVNEEEYIQDVKNIASYVGDYVSQIYLNLRSKQFNPVTQEASVPLWEPKSISDVKHISHQSRHQIHSYLKSAEDWLKQKYPDTIRDSSKWNIHHEIDNDGFITIYYKTNGYIKKYIV